MAAEPGLSSDPPKNKSKKISSKRLAANRRNAQKSTGPRTVEGKARSRQNALKHGMTGAGVVVHPDDREPLQTRLEDWTEDLRPADGFEGWLVGRAVLASVRLDRCTKVEKAALHDRVQGAILGWSEQERTLAKTLAMQIDTKPAETSKTLQAHSFGCEWLMKRWFELVQDLDSNGRWNRRNLERALHLLGINQPPTADAPEGLKQFWAAGLALEPSLDADAVDALRGVSTSKLARPERTAEARKHLPAAAAALELLRGTVAAEMDRLRPLMEKLWAEVDEPRRKRVGDRSLFDSSETGERMLRYEKANSAEVHRYVNLLFKKQEKDAKARAQKRDRKAERRELARDVVCLLKNRRSRRAAAPTENIGIGNGAAQQSVTPADESFVMPRGLAERAATTLAEAEAAPAQVGSQNEPINIPESVQTAIAPTGCAGGRDPGPTGPAAATTSD